MKGNGRRADDGGGTIGNVERRRMKERVAPKVCDSKAQGAALGLRCRAIRSPERASLDGSLNGGAIVGAYDQCGGAANPGLRPRCATHLLLLAAKRECWAIMGFFKRGQGLVPWSFTLASSRGRPHSHRPCRPAGCRRQPAGRHGERQVIRGACVSRYERESPGDKPLASKRCVEQRGLRPGLSSSAPVGRVSRSGSGLSLPPEERVRR